jgi:Bacterial tandem repeat domain 1
MVAKKPPESWFWSHDIESDQIDSLMMPGMHLMRLSAYGSGKARRFAALLFKEPAAERSYLLDVSAGELAAKIAATGAHPVSITAEALSDDVRFSLVLAKGPGSLSSVHVDLDEAGLAALVDDQHAIADLATYVVGGARKFAAIVEERAGQSWVFTGISAHELDARLLELGATLTRLRPYVDGGQRRFAAVLDRSNVGRWAWYADVDGDTVAKNLEDNDAYPYDLEATRDERGTRFTVVMYRDRAS